ncbi:MAG: agmatinase [Spirochaetales bacterium]|nr:agmatinase [Spirochaetales bacterium]
MIDFLDMPEEFRNPDDAQIIIIPVPYDETSTWKKGADKGPEKIIEAGYQLELYDIETDFEVYKKGILTYTGEFDLGSPEKMVESLSAKVEELMGKGLFPVILGGEHSVSLGPVKALKKKYPDLSVLQWDAHADLRDSYHGSRFNHACIMRRIKEECPVVQAGIRSMDISEKEAVDNDRIFYAHSIIGSNNWIWDAMRKLSDNVYITIDLDVLDPSIMPSTGTPEPGGLQWYELLSCLKKVCYEKNVVGFDIVELCPNNNHGAEFLAAKLVYKILGYCFYHRSEL